jgi:hypothetical protein
MTYTVKLSVPWKSCKSPWQIKNHGALAPQQQEIIDFIDYHNVRDVVYVTDTDALDQHNMHVLTINNSYCSVDQLCKMVKSLADHSNQYVWISVNKFFIYSTQENKFSLECSDWDLRLLNYVADQIPRWTAIKKVFRNDDHGQLGNFHYPVTALVAQRL